MPLPDIQFGSVDTPAIDWRAIADDDDLDDDSELAETPADVVSLLGFDPLDEEA
jgi:hypothetical protein